MLLPIKPPFLVLRSWVIDSKVGDQCSSIRRLLLKIGRAASKNMKRRLRNDTVAICMRYCCNIVPMGSLAFPFSSRFGLKAPDPFRLKLLETSPEPREDLIQHVTAESVELRSRPL